MHEEEALIRAFVVSSKHDRLVELLAHPKRRSKVTKSLAHFDDLDPRWVVPLPGTCHDVASVTQELRRRGAGDSCLVISEDSAIDGKRLPLGDTLERVIGQGVGTLLSCVPGVLGYFEGEGPSDRCILARRAI